MLKMNEVSKIYRTDLIETHALSNVNLTIEEGSLLRSQARQDRVKRPF